jgi:hypothetical protein
VKKKEWLKYSACGGKQVQLPLFRRNSPQKTQNDKKHKKKMGQLCTFFNYIEAPGFYHGLDLSFKDIQGKS